MTSWYTFDITHHANWDWLHSPQKQYAGNDQGVTALAKGLGTKKNYIHVSLAKIHIRFLLSLDIVLLL